MTTGPTPAQAPDHSGPVLFLLGLVMVGFLVVVWGLGRPAEEPAPPVEPPPFQQDRERDRDRDGEPRRGSGDGQQAAAGGARGVG
jgi:hypothetical protein